MTSTWPKPSYPVEVECKFCGGVLIIALKAKSKATVTEGHAPDCPMKVRDTRAR